MDRGPSPLLPSLLLLGLGLLLYWSSVMSTLDMVSSLFQFVSEADRSFIACMLVLLVLLVYVLIHLPSSFPYIGKSSYGMISSHDHDGFEFGLGTLLLVLLFLLLYYLI